MLFEELSFFPCSDPDSGTDTWARVKSANAPELLKWWSCSLPLTRIELKQEKWDKERTSVWETGIFTLSEDDGVPTGAAEQTPFWGTAFNIEPGPMRLHTIGKLKDREKINFLLHHLAPEPSYAWRQPPLLYIMWTNLSFTQTEFVDLNILSLKCDFTDTVRVVQMTQMNLT